MKLKINQSCTQQRLVQPHMLLSIVSFWMILNFYFWPRYTLVIQGKLHRYESVLSSIVVFWIVLSSFYASYHLMSFLFSLLARRNEDGVFRDYTSEPPVAILYTCMNDLKEKAVAACLAQNYPNFSVYILDDSTIATEQNRVDALRNKYAERVSIIRRKNRKGFKAGNLNFTLHNIAHSYKYVCVLDADELIPVNFLHEMVAIAEVNKEIAFFQASHQQYGETEYGTATGDGIEFHWNYFLPARNRFGFVYFYGHGALLNSQILMSVGGFPEVVSEDLALTARLREAGYRGYYVHNIKCFEETPPSYQAFCRRNRKIVSGTLDFLVRFYPSFLWSKKVSLVEKVDLFIASSLLYLSIPFLGFLFLVHLVIPSICEKDYFNIQATMVMFQPFHGLDFLLFILFITFAPLCYLLPNFLRCPKKAMLFLFRMYTINLSICFQTFKEVLIWVTTRRVFFIATGDRSQMMLGRLTGYAEALIGLVISILGVLMGSICLIAVGWSLMLVPMLIRRNLNGNFQATVALIPFVLTVLGIIGTPLFLVGVSGILAGVVLAHY